MHRVGQNRIYTPYMTEYSVISLPKIPYIHRAYMVLADPMSHAGCRAVGNLCDGFRVYDPTLLRPYNLLHAFRVAHCRAI